MQHRPLRTRGARAFAALALLASLLALAGGCGGASGASASGGRQHQLVLELDWYANPDHVGVFAALDRGLFRRRGLSLTVRPPANVSDPIKLVAAGRADLGISYEPELFYAQAHGAPVVAVAAIVPRALNSIIARGDEGIRTPADLRGKTIGVDGSASTSAYVDTVLRHAGLDPAHDVKIVSVGFNLVPALLSGRVDAIGGGFQNVEGVELRQRGLHPVVFPVDRYGVPGYDELVLVASRERLQADPAYRRAVRGFLAALVQGTAWARAHPGAATAIMARHVSAGYRSVLDASVPATLRLLRPPAGGRYGELDARAWSSFGAWMHRQGLLEQAPDARTLVDDSLLPAP